jgi:hypothetical protein
MRRPLAVAAAAGTLLAGGTALAATGAGPLDPVFGDRQDRDAELARELAARLDGVSADQVQKALDDLRNDKVKQRRKEEASALAKHLDGVSADDVEKALAKVQARLFSEPPRDGRPHRVDFASELAKELGKSAADIRKAFRAIHRERFDAMLDEAIKDGRLTKAQADRIRKRFENGPPRFHRGLRRSGRPHRFDGGPGFGPPGLEGPGPPGPPPHLRFR